MIGSFLLDFSHHVWHVCARHLQHGCICYGLGSLQSDGSALGQKLFHDLGLKRGNDWNFLPQWRSKCRFTEVQVLWNTPQTFILPSNTIHLNKTMKYSNCWEIDKLRQHNLLSYKPKYYIVIHPSSLIPATLLLLFLTPELS